MTTAVWTASIKDDISATSSKMSFSLKALDTTASDLFKKSHGNFKKFESDLKKAGVDTVDARLVTEKYRKELTATRREMLGLGDDAKKTSRSMGEITRGALRSIGEKAMNVPGMLVSGAVGAVTTIGEKVYDVGKSLVSSVIEAAQFRQNALTGLEYMLGSRREAEQIFAEAQELATKTPLDTKDVITGVKQLITGGFGGKEAMLMFKAVADQAAKFGPEMQENVITAFTRIKGRGVATGEDLDSLRKAGFRVEGIIDELLGKKGLEPLFSKIKIPGLHGGKTKFVDRSKADQLMIMKQVKETLGEGYISPETLINASIASLEKDHEGIGKFAEKMGAKSLTGTISNFQSAFFDLLTSVNIDEWEGVKQFQAFLTRITDMLKSDVGKGLLKTVENITNALLGGLANVKDSDIKSFIETLAKLGERVVSVIKEAWGWLKQLLDAKPGAFLDATKGVLIEAGMYIGKGLLQGVAAGAASVFNAERYSSVAQGSSGKAWGNLWQDTGGAAWRGIKGMWNRQDSTPALTSLTAAQGGYSPLNIPKFGDGAMVTKPTLAWVGESGPEAVVPMRTMSGEGYSALPSGGGRGGGLGGVSVSISIGSLSGMGDPTQAANTIADITVERLMLAVLERKALEA